jgi:hypothetical protein
MNSYQLSGPVITVAADVTPATGDVTTAEVTGNLSGGQTPLFLKVTNTSSTVPVFFNANLTVLSVATAGTVIGPGQTEFIQVIGSSAFQTVYYAASAASAVTVYVTPVILVG